MGALGEVGYLPGELGLYPALTGERTLDALARLHPRPPAERERLCEVLELDRAALRKRVREYSRGMKQKLGLVAALQHDPPLAILDEPTSGLDPVIQGRLLEWLAARAAAGRTIFFSSHVLAEVEELCDRVAMIREGRLLLVGPVSELRRARTRSVEVQFDAPVDPSRYAVPGVGGVEVDGTPAPLRAGRRAGAAAARRWRRSRCATSRSSGPAWRTPSAISTRAPRRREDDLRARPGARQGADRRARGRLRPLRAGRGAVVRLGRPERHPPARGRAAAGAAGAGRRRRHRHPHGLRRLRVPPPGRAGGAGGGRDLDGGGARPARPRTARPS